MKAFLGTCIENPFESAAKLDQIIEDGRLMSKAKFLEQCDVDNLIIMDIRRFPKDYTFYACGDIMWYEWSAIYHFYR
jgi:hypothetical protein